METCLNSDGSEPEIKRPLHIFSSGYLQSYEYCTLDAIFIQNPHWTMLLGLLKPFEPFAIYNSFSLVASVGQ